MNKNKSMKSSKKSILFMNIIIKSLRKILDLSFNFLEIHSMKKNVFFIHKK
jgi:hypothetical protein